MSFATSAQKPAPTNGAPAIRIEDLTKRFPRCLALDGVTFDIPANSVFGLVGPNGAGKTTLFSLVAGFLKPTRGRMEVLGIDVEQISELRGRLSILPQDALFQSNVPIMEQLTFFSRLTGLDYEAAKEEALQSLKIVGLEEAARKNPRVLSHGMAKRLGIAQAFMGSPEVVILDEPTSGLDPVNAKSIRQLIRELRRTGTVVVSSHNLREIQEICTHVAIIDKGKLMEYSDMESLTKATRQVRMSFAREMTDAEKRAVQGVQGVTGLSFNREENEYTIHLDLQRTPRPQDQVVAEIVQKLMTTGMMPRSINEGASLEARFLEVTGDAEPPQEVADVKPLDERFRKR